MKKDEFDEMFDAAFEEAAQHHQFVPDSELAWKRVERIIQRRSKRASRLKILPYTAASFIIGAVIFGTPTVTNAFNPLINTFKNIQDGFVNVIFGSDDPNPTSTPKTAPPPDHGEQSQSVGDDVNSGAATQVNFSSWGEVAKKVSFELPKIDFVPKGSNLDDIIVFFPQGSVKGSRAVFLYSGPDSFRISFTPMKRGERLNSGYKESDGSLEEFKINTGSAFVFLGKDGTSSVEFVHNNLHISILGNLDKQNIVEVANNIK